MSKVMEFKAKFIGDVSDITSNIKDLQQELNKLTLPDNLKGQFTKVINNLEKNTEKASKSLAAGFKTKGDVSNYEKTMNLIVSDMEKLSILMSRIDTSKLDFKVDGTQIKALVEYIAQLKAQIDAISTRKLTEVQEIASKRSDTKKNAASWTEFFEAFKKGDEGIDDCEKALKRLQNQVNKAAEKVGGVENLTGKWAEYAKDVKVYEAALSDLKGDSKDLVSIKEELAKKEEELKNIQKEYTKAGVESVQDAIESTKQMTEGTKQYAKESGEAAENTQQLSNSLDTFKNKAAYFFGLSNAVNLFKRAVRSAYNTVKDLDDVMTQTAVVTDFSVGDMWDQLPEYTRRANELGVSIHDAYEAATLYYQQGLKTNEVMAVSNETLKMARIAGLDAATATDRMTNALRGFNMTIDESNAQRVNDVYSKLAAITASNTNEISTAMTKTASLAHSANMEFETTAAFLAQMIETTRESAETAGTALKTVIARFSEVKKLYSEGELMGTDEEGEEIDVNKVSTALRSAGINMNEYLTGAKGLDDIFIELASKWDSLDMIQQRYIATMAAGSRQQSRFIAMMSDYKRTVELVSAANNSAGASQKQFEKTLDSLKSKLAQLGNSWNTFLMGIADNAVIKAVIDLLTDLLDIINKLFAGLDGLPGSIARVGAAFGMLMGGKALTKSLFKGLMGWAKEANKAGTEVGEGFIAGFKNRAKNSLKEGFKNFFSKEAWSFGLDTTVTKEIETIQQQIQSSSAAMAGALAEGGDAMAMFDYYQNEYAQSTEALSILQNEELANIDKILVARALESGELSAETLAEEGLTEELKKELREKYKQEALSKRTVLSLIAETIAKGELLTANKASTLWLGLEAKAANGNILAKYALAAADAFAAKSALGLMAATIASTAIIIAGAVAAYYLVKALYEVAHAEENAQKSAEENAETTKAAADNTTQAYNNLKDSLSALEEKYAALDNLTRGTQEWRDAVTEVNDEVLKLSDQYKDLNVISKNGILEITNTDEVKRKQYEYKINAQAAQRGANINLAEANSALARKQAGKSLEKAVFSNWVSQNSPLGKGLLKLFGLDTENTGKDFVKKEDDYEKARKEEIRVLEENNKYLAALAISNAELVKSTETESSNFMNANRMDSLVTDAFNEIYKEGLGFSQMKEQIAQESGYTSYGAYEKENGSISDEAAQQMLAEIRARKKATQSVELFSKKIDTSLPGMEALKKIYSREDLAGLTKEDIENLFNGAFDLDRFKASDEEGQLAMLGQVQVEADKIWTAMPDDLKEAFGNQEDFRRDILLAVERSAIGTDQGIERANRISSTGASSVFNQLSGGAANDLSKNLEEIFRVSGRAGVDAIQKDIDEITEGMDQGEAQKFVNAINSIDWKNASDVEGLEDFLEGVGITDVNVDDLTSHIIDLGNASKNVDLEKLTEQLKGMASFAQRIRSGEQGATGIKEEDMKNAVAAGIDPNLFVAELGKDTYTYIGDSILELADSLEEGIVKAIDTKNIQERIDNANIFNSLNDGSLNTENNGQLAGFLYKYINEGGTDVSKDAVTDALNNADNKELNNLYEIAKQNAEELGKNTEALKTQSEYEALSNDPSKNAELYTETGDDIYKRALLSQATQAGISEDLRKRNGVGDLASITNIFEEAQFLDYDTNGLNDYIEQLKILHGELDDVVIAQVALSNTKHVNGLKKIIDSYDTWTNLLKEDGTLVTDLDKESAKFIEEFKDATEEMLNTKLSDDFWYGEEAAKNIDLIKQAAEGSTEALIKLQTQAAKDYLISEVKIDKESAETELIEIENWLLENAPILDVGTSIDEGPFIEGLNDMMRKLNLSKTQMENILKSIHWEGKIVDLPGFEMPNPAYILSGGEEGSPTIKMPGGLRLISVTKSTGNSPSITPVKSSDGGGGSGSGKEDKPDYWENPYDELYNLQEKINEALRTREALERRYQKLLKQTASDLQTVTKAYYDQITHLRTEADLQNQMQAGRLRQIGELGQDIYTDSEGNRSTFASLGVTKYASYDAQTGTITIDWEGLEAIANDPNRTEEGKAAEAYISKLEELVGKFEEVRDKLWEIEDKIEELRQEAIDNYLTFEDRVMDALKNQYQQEIDDFKALSDTIKEATDEVISGIQEDVALARQIRDNTKKEEDIAEKEARLAYLKRDSSGANDLEVKKLEKELEQDRQDYSDTLVDQQIQAMQDEANKAAEQREHQIELMQHSLDMAIENGELWEEVYRLIDSSTNDEGVIIDNSPLMELLKSQEAFGSLSKIGQAKWWEEVTEAVKKALVGLGVAEDKYNIGDSDRRTGTSIDTFVSRLYEQILGRTADEAGKGWWAEQIQSGKMSRADVIKSFLNSDEFKNKKLNNDDFVEMLYQSFFGRAADKEGKEYWANQLKTGARSREDIINEFFKSAEWTNSMIPRGNTGEVGPIAGTKKPSYELYGSVRPEMVLDEKDSENIISLIDILKNTFGSQSGVAVKTNGGDNYFDINISAEIGSDYDVDQLADKIEQKIYNDSSYRNVNMIRGLR